MNIKPTKIEYGKGRIYTNSGKVDGVRCLILKDTGVERIVGTTQTATPPPMPQDEFDVLITFQNIESARLLQDILNELVCEWARDISPKEETLEEKQ